MMSTPLALYDCLQSELHSIPSSTFLYHAIRNSLGRHCSAPVHYGAARAWPSISLYLCTERLLSHRRSGDDGCPFCRSGSHKCSVSLCVMLLIQAISCQDKTTYFQAHFENLYISPHLAISFLIPQGLNGHLSTFMPPHKSTEDNPLINFHHCSMRTLHLVASLSCRLDQFGTLAC